MAALVAFSALVVVTGRAATGARFVLPAFQVSRAFFASATTLAGDVTGLASGAALLSTRLNTARAGSTDALKGAENLTGEADRLAAGVKTVQSGVDTLAGRAAQAASGSVKPMPSSSADARTACRPI